MEVQEKVLKSLAEAMWGDWMLCLMLGVGIFYTVITGGIQIRSLPYIVKHVVVGKKNQKNKKSEECSHALSSVQALYTAIASCVGSGNIVGVATALIAGGPGALFWMWAAAFLGMATKYGEIVLGMKYRQRDDNHMYMGGPMYYIAAGLHAPWLGAAAAVFLFIQNAGATLIQSNTISSVAKDVFGITPVFMGILLAVFILLVIRGGLKNLAAAAQNIVPVMAGIYVFGGFVVLVCNLDKMIPMLESIIQGAFSLKAGTGAAAGVTIKEAMRFGIARGLYSNEAGEGTAAVIHSTAEAEHPSLQGFYGIIEVFVDTMVICSTTGLAILASGVELEGTSAATLSAMAFGTVSHSFKYIVSLSLILFAATSIMSQWYFGHVSLAYIKIGRAHV